MLIQVMRSVNNFFVNFQQKADGEFKIENGQIELSEGFLVGQHIAITGSLLNDGVYLLEDDLYTLIGAKNEEFEGVVYGLRVPKDFLQLAAEIEKYVADNPASNIQSMSFGSYSQSFATNGQNGAVASWQAVFADRLKGFRRHMFKEIDL